MFKNIFFKSFLIKFFFENFKKNFKNFFQKIFFSIFFEVVIIWTLHLDVRKLCGCGHFWGYCGVCGQQPQQQLLSAHCCGAVTAYTRPEFWLLLLSKVLIRRVVPFQNYLASLIYNKKNFPDKIMYSEQFFYLPVFQNF